MYILAVQGNIAPLILQKGRATYMEVPNLEGYTVSRLTIKKKTDMALKSTSICTSTCIYTSQCDASLMPACGNTELSDYINCLT